VAGFLTAAGANVSNENCSERWHTLAQQERGKQISWSVEENRTLGLAVKACGENDWVSVSACVPTRTRHQCKQHWKLLKDATTRASRRIEWSKYDAKLLLAVKRLGPQNWTAVAEHLFDSKEPAHRCLRRWKILDKKSAREVAQKRNLAAELFSAGRNKKRRTTQLNLSEVAGALQRGLE
jgi:hypothetical protein